MNNEMNSIKYFLIFYLTFFSSLMNVNCFKMFIEILHSIFFVVSHESGIATWNHVLLIFVTGFIEPHMYEKFRLIIICHIFGESIIAIVENCWAFQEKQFNCDPQRMQILNCLRPISELTEEL